MRLLMHVALVTWRGLPELTADDQLVRDALAERGVRVTPAVWDDPAVDWAKFDRVVLRSTWDYHRNAERFLAWVDTVGGALRNRAPLVRWNAHKSYLLQLPNAVETFVRRPPSPLLHRKYVIKPAISATAYRTVVVDANDLEATLATFDCDMLVQPFIPEVVERGEWSLVFFRGEYSHAVLKRAKEGDFRVQTDFGGTFATSTPPPVLIDDARAILASVDETLYARVDGVEVGGRLMLMELELIEPVLFLASDAAAPGKFADAIVSG